MLCVFTFLSVHVYGQSDRCWAAIVIDFNAYWDALPIYTGGCNGRTQLYSAGGMEWLAV